MTRSRGAPPTPKNLRTLMLTLDEQDYAHVMGAVRRRELLGTPGLITRAGGRTQIIPQLPDGQGSREGRIIAEICRGWAEAVTGWDWMRGEPIDPDEHARLRKAAKAAADAKETSNEDLR